MRTGRCYVVMAMGSSALRELDLRVHDGEGNEVAQDSRDGAFSALRYCPPQSGMYFVVAKAMEGSGLFSVRRFRGPTGLEIRLDDVYRGPGNRAATERPPEAKPSVPDGTR